MWTRLCRNDTLFTPWECLRPQALLITKQRAKKDEEMTREKLQEVVNDPRDVIYFLSETPNVLGEGKSVTGYYCPPLKKNPHGICVQLRQFFGGGTAETYTSLHYEIEEYRKGIVVEIHSEMVEAFPSIHAFVYDQFKEGHELRFKGRERKGKLTIKKAYGWPAEFMQ